jgi:hypothetical protein
MPGYFQKKGPQQNSLVDLHYEDAKRAAPALPFFVSDRVSMNVLTWGLLLLFVMFFLAVVWFVTGSD